MFREENIYHIIVCIICLCVWQKWSEIATWVWRIVCHSEWRSLEHKRKWTRCSPTFANLCFARNYSVLG